MCQAAGHCQETNTVTAVVNNRILAEIARVATPGEYKWQHRVFSSRTRIQTFRSENNEIRGYPFPVGVKSVLSTQFLFSTSVE